MSAATPAGGSLETSALRRVWRSPLYRGATIAMVLSGLGASAAAPQIIPFLVKDLGAPLPLAGLYYLTSLAGPVAGYLVGRTSDRTGVRLGLFRLCALAGFVGWAGVALATAVWMPFVISGLMLAFAGAAVSQVFAAVHDEQAARPGPGYEGVVAVVRMALTAGWVVGPLAGAWLAAAFGLRAMFWMTALCFLLQIVPLGTLGERAPPKSPAEKSTAAKPPGVIALMPLLAFTALVVLVYSGESIKYGFLLIYMDEHLHLAPAVRGGVIGLQPLVELLIMPFSVPLGRRFGPLWLMAVAASLGVAANLCFAFWPAALGMIAGQVLMGGVWGVFMVLGLIVAQRLLPQAVATASAIFMTSMTFGIALGGIAGSFGVERLGLPHVFILPAGSALFAVVGLAVMAKAYPRHVAGASVA